jgi:copper chaperone CopZ
MTLQEYSVAGMTCDNCRRHVTRALAGIPGAGAVQVDLATGRATVQSNRAISRDEVRAALEEAGYELT